MHCLYPQLRARLLQVALTLAIFGIAQAAPLLDSNRPDGAGGSQAPHPP
jgi:hypothetical protein